jgi:hypothetical protein
LPAQVDEPRNPHTKATMGGPGGVAAHTRDRGGRYRGYVRRTIEPAFGAMPPAKVSAQVLGEFYADFGAAYAAGAGVPSAFD